MPTKGDKGDTVSTARLIIGDISMLVCTLEDMKALHLHTCVYYLGTEVRIKPG